jgi:hypothetical protein
MQQKWSELTDAAWISRFWALYRQLPDSFKTGFTGMARELARDLENPPACPPEQGDAGQEPSA